MTPTRRTPRILINKKQKQIFGTQFELVYDKTSIVEVKLKLIDNIDCVNKLRELCNLPTIEFYLNSMKERYITY